MKEVLEDDPAGINPNSGATKSPTKSEIQPLITMISIPDVLGATEGDVDLYYVQGTDLVEIEIIKGDTKISVIVSKKNLNKALTKLNA